MNLANIQMCQNTDHSTSCNVCNFKIRSRQEKVLYCLNVKDKFPQHKKGNTWAKNSQDLKGIKFSIYIFPCGILFNRLSQENQLEVQCHAMTVQE